MGVYLKILCNDTTLGEGNRKKVQKDQTNDGVIVMGDMITPARTDLIRKEFSKFEIMRTFIRTDRIITMICRRKLFCYRFPIIVNLICFFRPAEH